ncbi:MAG: HAD-IA family hydrolase [Bacteroidetes bacterium]|nr:HAD-IA family hydrolase [Bacteroidota bacterium]
MPLTHVFFDIGGVLGTNGWSAAQRTAAMQRFGIEPEMETRHLAVTVAFESGQLTLDAYLDAVVFDRPRAFSRADFEAFVLAQSAPFRPVLDVVRSLRQRYPDLRLGTMNNESDRLNRHRIETFGLTGLMDVFASSCWLGAVKPDPVFFRRALGVAGADAAHSLFFDDREVNVEAARSVGLDAVRFDAANVPLAVLTEALAARGLSAV